MLQSYPIKILAGVAVALACGIAAVGALAAPSSGPLAPGATEGGVLGQPTEPATAVPQGDLDRDRDRLQCRDPESDDCQAGAGPTEVDPDRDRDRDRDRLQCRDPESDDCDPQAVQTSTADEPEGVTPGSPQGAPYGPPEGVTPGPPEGAPYGPPEGVMPGPPAGAPYGPPGDE